MNNSIGIIVTPMERGQITIPKQYRTKLGIVPGLPLNVTMRGDEIVVKALKTFTEKVKKRTSPYSIKPKISKKEYLRLMTNMEGIHWTKEDDTALQKMRCKEKVWEL